MLRASRLILLAVAFSSACGGGTASAPNPAGPSVGTPQEARQYVESILNLMQAHSINRLTIDWTSFRATVLAEAAPAQKIGDTYPAVRTALRLLGDGHSFLQVPGGGVIYVPTRSCGAPPAATPAVPDGIGYVRVGSFTGSGGAAVTFANGIQEAIRNADRDGLVGWIVDLRGNGGGNMWPMIAGVGPVLGEGVLGYFIDPLGIENIWEYRAGASRLDGNNQVRVSTAYTLRRPAPRVAVLTDVAVASSGEALVVAFRLRPDTRSFGAATCGLSTANQSFPLIDGSTLFLTVSLMADRGHNPYGVPLVPDDQVDADQVVERAIDWLQTGR
jgi:carboxyl-terminal processing protease